MFDSMRPLPTSARACVDELDELERLKSSICARQARVASRLDALTPRASDRGTGAQLGLARHESPHRGRRLLSLARTLAEMPHTMAALDSGDLNERRAETIAREGQDLDAGDRRSYDDALATSEVFGLGDAEVQQAAQRVVMRIDEAGSARRRGQAHARRRVVGQRLVDGQMQITAVVSDIHGVAIMNALHERAAVELALGDKTGEDRSRGQIIADLFVERLTGQVTATSVPVAIHLVVSAETLLGDGDDPAEILGHGPIPASVARKLAVASPETSTTVRRLFADTDHLIAMESVSRTFDGLLRTFVMVRDQICRTPWCNGRIRHIDHVRAVADGARTTALDGQGLCESCNYLKEEFGWHQRVDSGAIERHEVVITSPSGHVYRSRAPAVAGHRVTAASPMEIYLSDLMLIA